MTVLMPMLEPTHKWAASRLVQASKRLRELDELLGDLNKNWDAWPTMTVASVDPYSTLIEEKQYLAELNVKASLVQFDASSLASEVVHHVRSALDYCVNQAVLKQKGTVNTVTKLPICASMSEWSDNDRRMTGLTQQQIKWIREIQPFREEGAWTWWLAKLSNGDKHHAPVAFTPSAKFSIAPLEGLEVGDEVPLLKRQIVLEIGQYETEKGEAEFVDALSLLKTFLVEAAKFVNNFLEEEGLDLMEVTIMPFPEEDEAA